MRSCIGTWVDLYGSLQSPRTQIPECGLGLGTASTPQAKVQAMAMNDSRQQDSRNPDRVWCTFVGVIRVSCSMVMLLESSANEASEKATKHAGSRSIGPPSFASW